MDTLVKRLQWARDAAGLSQRALSGLAGLASSHVQLIESGRAEGINVSTAQRLTGVLGVSLDWLMAGTGEMPTAEAVKAAVERAQASASVVRDTLVDASSEIAALAAVG